MHKLRRTYMKYTNDGPNFRKRKMRQMQFAFLCALVMCTIAGPVDIRKLDPNGVLFEGIGQAVSYEGEWLILHELETPEWKPTLDFLKLCEEKILSLCAGLCPPWYLEVTRQAERIKTKIAEIELFVGQKAVKPTRRKRGLINVGGSVLKFLFGTMDNEDAERVAAKMDEIDQSQDKFVHLAKEQVSFMRATTATVKGTLENITMYHNEVVRMVKTLQDGLEGSRLRLDLMEMRTGLQELGSYVLMALNRLQDEANDLLFILTALGRRELSPLLLPPTEFKEVYKKIMLEHTSREPIISLATLETVIEVDAYMEAGTIWVKIHVPLVKPRIHSVNRVHVFPFRPENQPWSLIDTATQYIINSTRHQRLYEFDELTFAAACVEANSTLYVCAEKKMSSTGPSKDNCVKALFRSSIFEEANCTINVLRNIVEAAVPLGTSNTWLLTLAKPTPFAAQCGEVREEEHLQGTIVVQLRQPCQFRLGPFVLNYVPTIVTTWNFHQPTAVEFPNLEKYKPLWDDKSHPVQHKPLQLMDLATLTKELKSSSSGLADMSAEIREIELTRQNARLHLQTHIVTGVFSVLVTLGIIYMVLRCLCREKEPVLPPRMEIITPHRFEDMPRVNQCARHHTVYETPRSRE